ncbi:MAG TPA: PAS domain-containing protein [Epulopiscium sp.]|nr:PAS domain-containing protein [Candidatus Epulonipiscium sp.]
MENRHIEPVEKAYIYSNNNMVYKVNKQFIQLTGYKENELIGKSLADISILLKSECQIPVQEIEEVRNLYIFNKDNNLTEVKISCEGLLNKNHKVHCLEEELDPILRCILYNLNNFDINPNESMAIFSYPGCILLGHSDNYIHTLSLMNISTKEIIGKPPTFSNDISLLLNKEITFHEHEIESVDVRGGATYWDINTKMVCGDKNKKYLVSSFYDVTERVQTRRLLEKQRREMQLILDNMSDTINIINSKGEYTYINTVGREKIAPFIAKETNVNSNMADQSFGINDINGDKILFENIPDQRVLRGERFNNQIIIGTSHLATTYFECDGIPIYDEKGNVEGGVLIYRDIENSYRIEEYLTFKENIKDVSVCYASFYPGDFKINYINEYAFNMIKKGNPHIKSVLELIGKSFFNFYRVKDKNAIQDIKRAMDNGSSYLHKHEYNEEGKVKYEKTLFQPTYNKHKEIDKIIAISIDISDEEIANRQIEKVLKAQDEMFINVSHELKTPVNVISSASQLLAAHLKNDSTETMKDDIRSTNKIIMRNCYRLTRLINNILDVSNIESGLYKLNLADCNVVDIIDDMVALVSEYVSTEGMEIIFDTQVDDIIIALDVYKFEKVLLNLISNAIKFSNPNGVIMINLVEKENAIEISVKDNGIGIPKEEINAIFEKFKQLNTSLHRVSEGTGIGLPLVKSIVELHQGSIKVESILGQGSTFTVTFPTRTLNSIAKNQKDIENEDKSEMVRFELSDIYA